MHTLHKLLLFHVLTSLGRDALGGKIINGKKAPENSMLYMVSLQNSRGQHLCGGFLISEDFVLTAAHCDGYRIFAKVVLGTHNLKAHGIKKSIVKWCKPESYKNVGQGNDIMLLKLSQKVQLDNSVQTIQLPTSGMNIRENEKCQVAGWGKTKTNGPGVDELRVMDVSTINKQVCEREWAVLPLPDNVICAGGYETNKGFCQGDSGGPLVCNGKAVGIVSFNHLRNCTYPNFPNVYTDISKYLPWINTIIKRKNSSYSIKGPTLQYMTPSARKQDSCLAGIMHALHKLLLFHLLISLGRDALGGKIIHGEKAPENSMLYMASLQNNRGQHVCGGFLISEDFVLTAAHCGNQLTHVVLGTHDLRRVAPGNKRLIEKTYAHPSYKNVGLGKDIMLLKLSQKVQLDNSVQTIQLPTSEMNIRDNEKCQVAGWGMTKSNGPTVDELRVVDVSPVNIHVCDKKWNLELPDNVICAGGYNTTKGFCQGDSGGPLVCNGKAVGIVSFNRGKDCDYPNVPNVYTDISKYLPWITYVLKGAE
ncbi:transmembrane protease serine 9 [Larimichthys crocea]|uniref:transmembrane protease serine 9 n=1 Tax=Larimichthys crocea TaxID=215358 RepID=UPI000F5EE26F|nr:transmembrane protease serine 9 [Larimichthys crocea]